MTPPDLPDLPAPGPAAAPATSVAIVGAGLAGLACAEVLTGAGHRVALFDKARGPGGRMSTRRVATAMGEASFDHGAQYFTVRDPDFHACVARWAALGLAARWPEAGDEAWVGVPAMNAPVRHMAAAQAVRWSARVDRLTRIAGGWQLIGEGLPDDAFAAVIVALPAEQAAVLLEPWHADLAAEAGATVSAPCWTTMLAFAAPLPTPAATLRDQGAIGWAARNSGKPGRTGPESWVVQASPAWSRAHLEAAADWVTATLTAELGAALGIALPTPVHAGSHRWRYARSGAAGGPGFRHAPAEGLAVCGDWLIGPRVEAAWLSGHRLGTHLAGQDLPRAAPGSRA
ncbi:NAD(P)/FAD-dependent oxidoreductase [Novosphingobium piscinae]|uniref:NAD(P)-binding protein n=1 Tax=Novosphingobium piscinae TaxID=1507448 RepID=A0A7X1FV95_9SPHN|nr:NAD(P)-binding protein [Novosphingobium piscinae]MBC2667623.1 NAD(P)-binding protein [Novosphingobium piscinae]